MARPSRKYTNIAPQQMKDTDKDTEGVALCSFRNITGDRSGTAAREILPAGRKKLILFAWGVMNTAGDTGETMQLKSGTSTASLTAVTDAVDISGKGDKDLYTFGEIDDAASGLAEGTALYAQNASSGGSLVGVIYTYAP